MKNIFFCILFLSVSYLHAQSFSNTRLSKVLQYREGKKEIDMGYFFHYDKDGRLSKLKYYQDGKLFDTASAFKYDEQGKISSYREIALIETYPDPIHDYNFGYDNKGRIIKYAETHKNADGQQVSGEVYTYNYGENNVTRIFQNRGTTINRTQFILNDDGYLKNDSANTNHPNPYALLGSGVFATEWAIYPITHFFQEKPKVVQPTFGTTYTKYKYDNNGLLLEENWEYFTEKGHVRTSAGTTKYEYTTISSK